MATRTAAGRPPCQAAGEEVAVTEAREAYPVRVDAPVEPSASRWLWLVKWLLLVPHYVVLALLWPAVVVVSVIAFVAILVTGRYPRVLFDFTAGVLRWTWRVHYYGYGALGTDRYPPFTLADVPDHPAHLDVAYPERLSRGLVLVKWWLLALPHYVVVAVFVGGGIWIGTGGRDGDGIWDTSWGAGGLVGLLVFVAGVVLLFTGRYPRPLYDFVLGMDRWVLRVAAYAALMTDAYPPFRLDMGGPEPGSVPAGPTAPAPTGAPAAARPATPPPATSWTAGRVVALATGALLLFGAAGVLVGGGALLWADRTQRDGGYLMSPATEVGTDRYAVTSESLDLRGEGLDWAVDEVIGTVRIDVTPAGADDALFVGVARSADVDAYLRGVGHVELVEAGAGDGGPARSTTTDRPGGAPGQPPTETGMWVAAATGTGTPSLTWRPTDGDWTVVLMRADGTAGVAADVRTGATAPGLGWLAGGLFAAGALLLALGGLLVGLAVHRAQTPPPGEVPASGPPPPPAGPAGAEPLVSPREPPYARPPARR